MPHEKIRVISGILIFLNTVLMPRFKLIFALLLVFVGYQSHAGLANADTVCVLQLSQEQVVLLETAQGPGPLVKFLHKKERFNRKVTAAVLAFPFPFGMVGVHRIYLGCAPYIPIVYIGSLGGIFGIVPLIDFVVILASDDVERFANSGKVFMWVE